MGELQAVIDGRCGCSACRERTENIYRMVGWCSNCGTQNILILYRAGDHKRDIDCPICENYFSIKSTSQRLATADEIPAAVIPSHD